MIELFVPGRICLFGEHSDWAGGYRRVNPQLEKGFTLISGTDQGIYAKVSRHADSLVLSATSPDGRARGPVTIPMKADVLLECAQQGDYWSYVAGVAYHVLVRHAVPGLRIQNDYTDLPVKRGLSSSAAICVLSARAFNQLYDLGLSLQDEMELAYQGETTTPSRCGRMDQGCAFGRRSVLMTFDADSVEAGEVKVGGPFHLLLVDLGTDKNTKKILNDLNACFPRASHGIARGVQRLLGPINREIVTRAVAALAAGDARQLGHLMTEAQAHFNRLAVPACPEELSAPVLNRLLAYQPLRAHVWGGKGVGSQGDGAAQFVARSATDRQIAMNTIMGEFGMRCLTLTLDPSG